MNLCRIPYIVEIEKYIFLLLLFNLWTSVAFPILSKKKNIFFYFYCLFYEKINATSFLY